MCRVKKVVDLVIDIMQLLDCQGFDSKGGNVCVITELSGLNEQFNLQIFVVILKYAKSIF